MDDETTHDWKSSYSRKRENKLINKVIPPKRSKQVELVVVLDAHDDEPIIRQPPVPIRVPNRRSQRLARKQRSKSMQVTEEVDGVLVDRPVSPPAKETFVSWIYKSMFG